MIRIEGGLSLCPPFSLTRRKGGGGRERSQGWVYWGVTVSEIIGGVLMLVISKHEFRKVHKAMLGSAPDAGPES